MLKFEEQKLEFEWKGVTYTLRFPYVGESEEFLSKLANGLALSKDVYDFFEKCGLEKEVLDGMQQNHVQELLMTLTGQKKSQ